MAGDEVTVRELRQNLSVHLRRVQDGETLTVTNRGQRVAMLAPIGGASRFARLVAEGRVTLPDEAGLLDAPPAGPALSAAVIAERDEDDR